MNHQEIQELLPLYALGGLDAESTGVVERHLTESCDSCATELREWQELVGLIPLGVTLPGPGAEVKARLMARVRQDLGAQVIPLRSRRWRPTWVALPLAAAATVLLAIGGLRYQEAVKSATEQAARAQTVLALLAQEQEKLGSREAELQQLQTQLTAQQAATAEKTQLATQLEASLAEQRQLVSLREQELARVQGGGVQEQVATYARQIAELQSDLARQRETVVGREQELGELRAALEQQRLLMAASTRETDQLRDALTRQRGVSEVLSTPGLQVGYLRQAKVGVPTQGHVLWNERKKAWVFYAFGMPQPPEGKEYQVWFMTEKEGPVSAGLFTPDQSGSGLLLATPPPKLSGKITAAAITIEPAGGLPKPSGEMYLRGSL